MKSITMFALFVFILLSCNNEIPYESINPSEMNMALDNDGLIHDNSLSAQWVFEEALKSGTNKRLIDYIVKNNLNRCERIIRVISIFLPNKVENKSPLVSQGIHGDMPVGLDLYHYFLFYKNDIIVVLSGNANNKSTNEEDSVNVNIFKTTIKNKSNSFKFLLEPNLLSKINSIHGKYDNYARFYSIMDRERNITFMFDPYLEFESDDLELSSINYLNKFRDVDSIYNYYADSLSIKVE